LRGTAIAGVVLLLAGIANFGPSYPVSDSGPPGGSVSSVVAQVRNDAGPPDLPQATVEIPHIAIHGTKYSRTGRRQSASGAR
jgi:hypothetical protein